MVKSNTGFSIFLPHGTTRKQGRYIPDSVAYYYAIVLSAESPRTQENTPSNTPTLYFNKHSTFQSFLIFSKSLVLKQLKKCTFVSGNRSSNQTKTT